MESVAEKHLLTLSMSKGSITTECARVWYQIFALRSSKLIEKCPVRRRSLKNICSAELRSKYSL